MIKKFKKSEKFLSRAERVIPLGSQTFSKSKTLLPLGASPFFAEKGKGSKLYDLDGNKFIDFVNGLASVTLGYRDSDIDNSVKKQLKKGVTFSLSHPIETQLAEMLTNIIPCAEMVRFAKNGSDATSAAIRVARAFTGREHIAVCGYHGWHDWYIGSTTRDLGITNEGKKSTHRFKYNNIEDLESLLQSKKNKFAAVIMEPMNTTWPKKGYLKKVASICRSHGALFIFDEIITGFRFHLSGAQKYFNVTPDLATFGKGIANGYPLSVLAGKKKYMNIVEDIFFSGTFGGETLSIAAAIASIDKYKKHNVVAHLETQGKKIIKGTENLIEKNSLSNYLSISGHPSWSFINFLPNKKIPPLSIKTLFIQEVLKRGIYALGSHNLSYSHTNQDIKKLLSCYKEVFSILAQALNKGDISKYLECDPIKPLFKVR